MIRTKKILIITILATALYLLQVHWAMGEYFNNLSGGCLDCSIWIELIFNSVFQLIILIPFYLICWRFGMRNKWQIIISSIFLSFWWLDSNNSIFKDRVSGWSTFLTSEEWASTIDLSFFPILVCIIVFALALNWILKLKKK